MKVVRSTEAEGCPDVVESKRMAARGDGAQIPDGFGSRGRARQSHEQPRSLFMAGGDLLQRLVVEIGGGALRDLLQAFWALQVKMSAIFWSPSAPRNAKERDDGTRADSGDDANEGRRPVSPHPTSNPAP